MYFPYLRGKQYELLALRDLGHSLGETSVTHPIIEPVRQSEGSGLRRCVAAMEAGGLPYTLIVNPTVGALRGPTVSLDIARFVRSDDHEFGGALGLVLADATEVDPLLRSYGDQFGSDFQLTLIHKGVPQYDGDLAHETRAMGRSVDVIDDKNRQRHFRQYLSDSDGVTLRDNFTVADRNSDYLERAEVEFSDDHLYFRDEGWNGFSDYLTVGEPYSEGGFMPRAVAIHWTYEREIGSPIYVRSFTSESNGDTSNVGGKFLEAATKLVAFLDERDIGTAAAGIVRSHVAAGTFPGLGTVKKLSIQNHLELVAGILSRA